MNIILLKTLSVLICIAVGLGLLQLLEIGAYYLKIVIEERIYKPKELKDER